MTIELWLAFTLAAAGLIMIPGPTVLLVVGFGFSAGARAAFLSMIGVALGDIAAIALSFLGVGALLAISAELFMLLKFAGALYLLYLGIKLWRAPVAPLGAGPILPATRGMIGKAFLVTFLNPKGILFFTAFMPQFIVGSEPALPQMLILGATFLVLSQAMLAGFVLLSLRTRRIAATPRALKLFNRVGGSILVGAGVMTAALRHR
jgi:threonine/homoserine/homoserine lactone efflux protein